MKIRSFVRNVSNILFGLTLVLLPMSAIRAQGTQAQQAEQATKSAAQKAGQTATSAANSAKTTVTGKPSQADIDAAKASGKVWVNTDTGVYHKSGHYYGNTKHGKFMAENDAVKAGYHAAKNEQEP